jgi:hypothetical protein
MWDEYTVSCIASHLGLRITTDDRTSFSAALHWKDATRRPRSVVLEEVGKVMHVINLRGNDISKSRVDAVMHEVFGYGLGVDPFTSVGPLVEKSELNGLHDGRIIDAPITTRLADRVYQRLIRGRRVGDVVEEIRVPVVGHRIPFVHLKYKRADDPLALSIHGTIAETSAVLSQVEIGALIRLAHTLGIDFGEFDTMRDQSDGRVYVFDANNTPCVRFAGVSTTDRRATISKLAEAFETAFLSPPGLSEVGSKHNERQRSRPVN